MVMRHGQPYDPPDVGVGFGNSGARFDESVHLAADCPPVARWAPGPDPRENVSGSVAHRWMTVEFTDITAQDRNDSRSRKNPAFLNLLARQLFRQKRFPIPWPRYPLPDRARRRAQTQGNFLHPRRRLSGRRNETRPERADRRKSSGGRVGNARRVRSGLGHPLRKKQPPTFKK